MLLNCTPRSWILLDSHVYGLVVALIESKMELKSSQKFQENIYNQYSRMCILKHSQSEFQFLELLPATLANVLQFRNLHSITSQTYETLILIIQ